TILAQVRSRGERRATATVMVHAVPPADRLSSTLTSVVGERLATEEFYLEVVPGSSPRGDEPLASLALSDGFELRVLPAPLMAAEVRLRAEQSARTGALLLLALLGISFVILVWPAYGMAGRAWVLATGLAVLGLVPFNEASNVTRLF